MRRAFVLGAPAVGVLDHSAPVENRYGARRPGTGRVEVEKIKDNLYSLRAAGESACS
jgi:hypothetical protein